MTSAGSVPRIAFRDITVDFGATRALDGVDFAIEGGEVVGLLGHNGAGKSTLVSIAAGVLRPSGGHLEIDGAPVMQPSPQTLARQGLTIVNQEPTLVATLSIYDNLFLGRADIPRRERAVRAAETLTKVGLEGLSPRTLVGELPTGQRQLVDVARGMMTGDVKVMFLDEPTAALGAAETERLHELIRELADAGAAVVYVSHRLPDILDVCTRIVVLNAGRVVTDEPASALTTRDLSVALAPGFEDLEQHTRAIEGEVALRIDGPSEMTFHCGEIVGVFGMAAGNQFRLMESVFGARQHQSVSSFVYELDGTAFAPKSPKAAIAAGVVMVPADREVDGLLRNLSARDNVLLPWFRAHAAMGTVWPSTGAAAYQDAREAMGIRGPEGAVPIAAFSGGNKQKHLLARWIYPHRPRVLLLNQPTQGVDIGAKNDIVRALRTLADEGVTIIVASSESDEIARMCSRSYVIHDVEAAEILSGPHMEEQLLSTLLELAGRQ